MGKTKDLFNKTRDIKGTSHARMGTVRDRNGKDLTETGKIKKMWQEYTELQKRGLNDWCGNSTRADILQCEVKRTLGGITANKAS